MCYIYQPLCRRLRYFNEASHGSTFFNRLNLFWLSMYYYFICMYITSSCNYLLTRLNLNHVLINYQLKILNHYGVNQLHRLKFVSLSVSKNCQHHHQHQHHYHHYHHHFIIISAIINGIINITDV